MNSPRATANKGVISSDHKLRDMDCIWNLQSSPSDMLFR